MECKLCHKEVSLRVVYLKESTRREIYRARSSSRLLRRAWWTRHDRGDRIRLGSGSVEHGPAGEMRDAEEMCRAVNFLMRTLRCRNASIRATPDGRAMLTWRA